LDTASARRAARALAGGMAATVLIDADSAEVALSRAAALTAHAGREPVALEISRPELLALALTHALVRGQVPLLRVAHSDGPDPPPLFDGGAHPWPLVLCGR